MSLVLRNLNLRSHSNIVKLLHPWPQTSSRTYASKKNCVEPQRTNPRLRKCPPYKAPECAKEFLEKKPPCHEKEMREQLGQEPPHVNSMWENPECCTDPCPDFFPRHDQLYYKISDKAKRKYQQTWVGFPPMLKRRKCCDLSKAEYPVYEKRSPKQRPKTACQSKGSKLCVIKKATKCPRTTLCGCPGSRIPPKCNPVHIPTNCKKECAPYPSFSECMRNLPLPLHPKECKCLTLPMMCEVWAEVRRRMTFRK